MAMCKQGEVFTRSNWGPEWLIIGNHRYTEVFPSRAKEYDPEAYQRRKEREGRVNKGYKCVANGGRKISVEYIATGKVVVYNDYKDAADALGLAPATIVSKISKYKCERVAHNGVIIKYVE